YDGTSFDASGNTHWIFTNPACATATSVASSSWSLTTTWDTGFVPINCTPVVIAGGTAVTLDISTATASTTTINGTLQYKRSGDNELTLVGGNMDVYGTLDMGQASGVGSGPIPAGTTAYLILSSGTTAGQYGLIVHNGGNFLVYGAAKTPSTTLTSPSTVGPSTTSITVADATGWQNGDTVTIDTEAVTISGLSGNTFTITPVTLTHYRTNTV